MARMWKNPGFMLDDRRVLDQIEGMARARAAAGVPAEPAIASIGIDAALEEFHADHARRHAAAKAKQLTDSTLDWADGII